MAVNAKRKPFALYCDEPSLTKQSFTEECDINLIIARARNGADISHLNARVAQYGDFSKVPDYRAALDTVRQANDLFMSLDAGIRERFANDPGRMISFLQNPSNLDEAVRLGLVVKTPLGDKNPPLESQARGQEFDPGLDSEESSEPQPAHSKGKGKGSK